MPDYTASITTKDFIQLSEFGNRYLVPMTLGTDATDPNWSADFDVLEQPGQGDVKVWADSDGTIPQGLPWVGKVANLPRVMWLEGLVASPASLNDVKLTLRIDAYGEGIRADDYVTVVKPYVDVYTDIQYEQPLSSSERNLLRITESSGPYSRTLGGIRLRMELRAVPAAAISSLVESSITWATTDPGKATFYDSYHVTADITSGDGEEEVYWERHEADSLPNATTISVEYTLTSGTSTQIEHSFEMRSRALQEGVPPGDDILMLYQLSNYLGHTTHGTRESWTNVVGTLAASTIEFVGSTIGKRVTQFGTANDFGYETSSVGVKELDWYNKHHDDYRNARNAYGWDNGNLDPQHPDYAPTLSIYANQRVTTDKLVAWVKTWAATIDQIPPGIENSPATGPQGYKCGIYECTDTINAGDYPLAEDDTLEEWVMLKICEWESACQYHHWENWEIVVSPGVGALGFAQIMPFNSKRFDPLGVVNASANLYDPSGNLNACSQYLNHWCQDAYGNLASNPKWEVGNEGDGAVLAKVCMHYNGGRRAILQSNTYIACVEGTSVPAPPLDSEQRNYGIALFERLGLVIENGP